MMLVFPIVTSIFQSSVRLFLVVIWNINVTQHCEDIRNSKLYDKLPI